MDTNRTSFSMDALAARFLRCADFMTRRIDAGLDPARPVVITAEGADEAAACEAMEEYIRSQM